MRVYPTARSEQQESLDLAVTNHAWCFDRQQKSVASKTNHYLVGPLQKATKSYHPSPEPLCKASKTKAFAKHPMVWWVSSLPVWDPSLVAPCSAQREAESSSLLHRLLAHRGCDPQEMKQPQGGGYLWALWWFSTVVGCCLMGFESKSSEKPKDQSCLSAVRGAHLRKEIIWQSVQQLQKKHSTSTYIL